MSMANVHNNEMGFLGVNQPNQNLANNNGNFSIQSYSGSGLGSGLGSRSLQADHMIFYDPQPSWMVQPYSTVSAFQNGGGQSAHFRNDLQNQVPSFDDVTPYSVMSGMRPHGFGNQSGHYEFDRMYPQVQNSNNLSIPSWALQPTYNQQHQLDQATIIGAVNPKMVNSMTSQTSIPSGGMAQYPSGAIMSSSTSVHYEAQQRELHSEDGILSMLNPNQVQYYQGNGDNNLSSPYNSIPQNGVHIPSQIYEPKNTRIGTLFDPSLKLFEESEFFDKYNRP